MKTKAESANRDPITGEPGSHPIGTGVGSLTGTVTGAFVGALGGPVGMAIGGVVGAIAGAATGHGVAEELEPTADDSHWERNYRTQSYYLDDYDFGDYEPAYRAGFEGHARSRGRSFEESEQELASRWEEARGMSRLAWEQARPAVRDGWHRREDTTPGATDRSAG